MQQWRGELHVHINAYDTCIYGSRSLLSYKPATCQKVLHSVAVPFCNPFFNLSDWGAAPCEKYMYNRGLDVWSRSCTKKSLGNFAYSSLNFTGGEKVRSFYSIFDSVAFKFAFVSIASNISQIWKKLVKRRWLVYVLANFGTIQLT